MAIVVGDNEPRQYRHRKFKEMLRRMHSLVVGMDHPEMAGAVRQLVALVDHRLATSDQTSVSTNKKTELIQWLNFHDGLRTIERN
ncbi:hypothetical protein Tcan_02320 [Toxocara canis]|uniref:Uncharacterized protein n=1 Tax=Toxocara canis TaxID=6265 RepID=A0A0B2UPS3_TOXCA|nr:hypothetical protein Tcan_02320 [Toxocara canis]